MQHAPSVLVARALEGALRFWAIKEPAGAFAFAEGEVRNGALRLKLLQQVVHTWIRRDESACVTSITNLPSAIDRVSIATALLSDLNGVNPSTVWQIVQSLDSRSGARLQLLAGLAEHWVREDRQAAFTWLQSLAEADFAAAASKVLPAFAGIDPVQASAVADGLGESLSFELRCDILREWAATDIDAALKWAEKIKDPQKQTLAKRNAIAVVAKTDPVKAYDLTKTLPLASQVDAAIDIAAQWSKRDVRSAAEWVQTFPSGPFKEKAMILLAREWAANDTEAAVVWLRKLPSGMERDKIVSEYAESITQFRPDLASYWSLNIQDESESHRRLLEAFSKWYFVSPTEASAWLEKTDLPAPLKARLLKLSRR